VKYISILLTSPELIQGIFPLSQYSGWEVLGVAPAQHLAKFEIFKYSILLVFSNNFPRQNSY
jgi:hypothetical protein